MNARPIRPPEPENCPQWLKATTREEASPFHRVTREHLRARATRDPDVFALIERLQEKDQQNPGEGRREWEWAKRIGLNPEAALRDLHQQLSPGDEQDVLRLAAYASDHSYVHFFTHYASRLNGAGIAGNERGLYNEAVQRIAPVVAELQPSVAIGFAPQIFEVFQHIGQPEKALALFTGIARKKPFEVLAKPERFVEMPDVLAVAERASASSKPATPLEAGYARNVEARREIAAAQRREGRI